MHSKPFALLALALVIASCAPAASNGEGAPPIPRQRVVGTFKGVLDAHAGTLTIQPEAPRSSSALTEVPVVQDGTPGTNPPDTVELVTEAVQETVLACGAVDAFEGDVRLRSFFADKQLRNVHVEVVAMSSVGREACNSSPEVEGTSARYGLWSYGNLAPAGASTDDNALARWSFRIPDRTSFTFWGRVLADVLAPTCELAFPNPPPVDVQVGAYALVAGDLGGDGIPDLVVANSTNASVSVAKGLGRGRFGPSVRLAAAGTTPYAVAVADVSGDGRPDILVVDNGGSRLGRFLQLADGSFGTYTSYVAGTGARAFAAADLDGDGDVDVAMANTTVGTIGLFANDGAGNFGTMISLALGAGASPNGITVGDADGDGVRDIVVATGAAASVVVLENVGWGSPLSASSFAAPVSFPNGSPALPTTGLALGDFDADGDLDAAVLTSTTVNNVTIHLNDGAGGYSVSGRLTLTATGLRTIAAGDVTGDGIPDMVLPSSTANQVVVLRGLGGASFAAATSLEAGQGTYGVAIADLDGDGRLDLAAANNTGGDVTLMLGREGGPRSFDAYALPVGKDLLAADLDGDGNMDVVASENAGVRPFLNSGGLVLAPQALLTAGLSPYALAAGDLDADLDVDVVVANISSHNLSVFRNSGDGTFSAAASYPTGTGTGSTLTSSPRDVAIADTDLDGLPDLVAANLQTGTISVNRNLGGGSFSLTPALLAGCTSPVGIAAADLNGDGRTDLVAACQGAAPVAAVFMNSAGGLLPAVTYPTTGLTPASVTVGDLNGDGWLDLVIPSSRWAFIFWNQGDGTFGYAQLISSFLVSGPASSAAIADLDRDEIPDLVFGTTSRNVVSVVRGLGGMNFADPFHVATRRSALSVVPVDLDGDTRLDLVAVSNGNGLAVLPGACLP